MNLIHGIIFGSGQGRGVLPNTFANFTIHYISATYDLKLHIVTPSPLSLFTMIGTWH